MVETKSAGDLPRRARLKDVPRAERWSLGSVYELEKNRIRSWLESMAERNFSERDATVDSVMGSGGILVRQLEGVFSRKSRHFSHEIMSKAEKGELGREAGSPGLIRTFSTLKWIAFFAEIFVFVLLMFFEGMNIVVVIQGFLLALSGYVLGYGTSIVLGESDDPNYQTKTTPGIFLAALGAVGIIGICAVRSIADPPNAFAVVTVTSILALLVAVFEALHELRSRKYNDRWQKEFQAQVWWATEQHAEDNSKGVWRDLYENKVRLISGGISSFFENAKSTEGPAAKGFENDTEESSFR